LTALFLLAVVAVAGSSCSDAPSGGGDTPVSATPGTPTTTTDSPLHNARLDASGSRRLNVDPLKVELVSLRQAGWDGCLGVSSPGTACPQLFVAGYIAIFRGGDKEATYHIGMGRFVGPVDPVKSIVDDGSPVSPEMRIDFNAVLALYARHELALRTKAGVGGIAVEAIVPVTFPDACLGWERPGFGICALMTVPGAIILLRGPDGKRYRYQVSEQGVVATDFVAGRATLEPPPGIVDVQRRMREDLARRTGAAVESLSVTAFRPVTWPNGCLGVNQPGTVCTQALVEGFLATLSDASGTAYRYHGTGDRFIAASFERGATLADPLPPPP